MYSKEDAKEKLAKLIDKFNSHPRKDSLSEEDTRTFIRDLFEILGWDFKSSEVNQEEHIASKGFVDYGFRLNNSPVMFVEAKKTSENLINTKFYNQVTDYAWYKATTWAVLTNFKHTRIINAYIKGNYQASILRDIEIQNYLNHFDYLWLLSKESFEQKLIDTTAEDEGKKAKEKPVVKALFEDLNKWRQELANDIKKNYGQKYSTEEIDEMVQVLLDRFILVRKIEDEGHEDRKLEEIHHHWLDAQNKKSLWMYLRELFTTSEESFEQNYDSKIFEYSEVDKLEISDYPLKIILKGLYESEDKTIRYNFALIDADILGNIYEQYLGYILKTTAKKASGETSKAKRKEQGIYYTPRYIVDYIVKNTIGEKLKECKNWQDVEKLKVLDPACGSGSFLIKAFDEIYAWYEENKMENKFFITENSDKNFETPKDRIIKNNIFGVDLDHKAVEIAQLNLLLKTADKKHKLPQLRGNIKTGNSLIDDEKISPNAFSWNKEFPEIMKNGGFDIIIGNPPYVKIQTFIEDNNEEKIFFEKNYIAATSNFDLYVLFVERAFNLLKENGILGMILPHKFFQSEFGNGLRKFINTKECLCQIVDFGDNQIFDGATTYTCLLFLKKKKLTEFTYYKIPQTKKISNVLTQLEQKQPKNKNYEELQILTEVLNKNKWVFTSSKEEVILKKIKESSNLNLGTFCKTIFQGVATGADKIFFVENKGKKNGLTHVYSKSLNKEIPIEIEILKPLVKGNVLKRFGKIETKESLLFPYELNDKGKIALITETKLKSKFPLAYAYLKNFEKNLRQRENNKFNSNQWFCFSRNQGMSYLQTKKILTPDICQKGQSTIDETGDFLTTTTVYGVIPNQKKDFNYLLALLNSSILLYFIKKTGSILRGGFYRYKTEYLKPFSVAKINESQQITINELVNKILNLNKKINLLADKQTSERQKIEEEIKRTDKEIDELVYQLYGLTEEEKKIIEENL